MNKFVILTAAVFFVASPTYSQEAPVVAPPVSDPVVEEPVAGAPTAPDQTESDQGKPKKHHPKKARKANFGMIVSAEAHRLKAEGLNGKQKMGPWVSNQRRQNENTKSNSAGKSEQTSNPTGGAPGKSGSHRK